MADIALPEPVRLLVAAVNDGDLAGFVGAFTEDGVVEDWGREFTGHEQIREWSERESIGVRQTFDVRSAEEDGDDVMTVIDVGGDGYNGLSTFRFTLDGDRVSRMRITE
ncbi:SnoaL-like protein [Stackebrandtia albiflava]|uniref:SnoaL-like protein n=1 Tax=Stackebrandtia albiflava TaxID=406432 RepID=A0A562V0G9_9ACTN|nr:nuclear transport factor 2 family protein [Stackebrandtia albiflava]TWJ11440.1 SnoaL-like protein [Stackebrandtia albiflava]